MTALSPRSWLPSNAIAAAAEKSPLRAAVADWTAKWIAQPGASSFAMEAVTDDFRLDGAAMEAEDGVIVVADPDAAAAIGKLMFGDPSGMATSADSAAIDRAVQQTLADLRQRVAQALGLPRDTQWHAREGDAWPAGYCYRTKLGAARLDILVAERLLIAGIRTRLRPDPVRAALGTKAAGLAPQPVTLSAMLGASRLTTRELAALGQGDVVVLDRRLDDPVAVVIDQVPQRAKCRIAAGADHLDLTLA